ncbi:MAG: hypothetical protein LBU99_00155, partial [Spirochaetaceae bacterium]|nr:hypothetical protein [Spirochaetaceae bacterium]
MTFVTKKTVALLLGTLLSLISAFAMDMEGSFMLNGGANIGILQPHFTGSTNMDTTVHIGGRLQADYMLSQYLSIGLESGFSTAKTGDTDFSIGTVPILARFAWHPFSLQKWDPYLVGKAGYGFSFWTAEGDDYDWTDIHGGFMWG